MAIEVGNKVKGKIAAITNFGAFIELPEGKTGLVHISEVAHNYVKDIREHLTIGQEVEVKVLGERDGKISLSIKKTIEQPERESTSSKPSYRQGKGDFRPKGNRPKSNFVPKENFEDKLTKFLKSSEENLSSLKRSTETKRGGRGGRRG
jgi:S1 RNA binding domain protein